MSAGPAFWSAYASPRAWKTSLMLMFSFADVSKKRTPFAAAYFRALSLSTYQVSVGRSHLFPQSAMIVLVMDFCFTSWTHCFARSNEFASDTSYAMIANWVPR